MKYSDYCVKLTTLVLPASCLNNQLRPDQPNNQKTNNAVDLCIDLNMSLPIYQLCTDPPASLKNARLQVMDQPAGTAINQSGCRRRMHAVQRQLRLRLKLSARKCTRLLTSWKRETSLSGFHSHVDFGTRSWSSQVITEASGFICSFRCVVLLMECKLWACNGTVIQRDALHLVFDLLLFLSLTAERQQWLWPIRRTVLTGRDSASLEDNQLGYVVRPSRYLPHCD